MKDSAFFCPACGSPSVETSLLSGGEATCKACSWKGTREELVNLPFEHSFASQEEMLTRFVNQLSSTIAKTSAQEVGRILLQWGFLNTEDPAVMQNELKIYIRMIAVAATKQIVETRQHLERAKAQAGKNGSN